MVQRRQIYRGADVHARLEAAITLSGGLVRFARGQGLDPAHVGRVRRRTRPPGDSLLRVLGLQAEVTTVYVAREPEAVELIGADGEVLVRAARVFS